MINLRILILNSLNSCLNILHYDQFLFEDFIDFRENHPYDVCEVITTSIEGGNQPYLDWLAKTVPEKK
jgi:hypothetical protein